MAQDTSKKPSYSQETNSIRVTVEPVFLEDQSAPEASHFVWAYHVHIENCGSETVQLKSRFWRIMNAEGKIHEVRGPGVVGEQPVLRPGESYEYTSGTPLETPSGIMDGHYYMVTDDGENLDVIIPAFSLDSPHDKPVYH